jgi:predicted nucleic acid-binding protein
MRSSTARRSECYVDTSALIAFLDRSDSYHSIFTKLFSEPPPLVTSGLVIAEGHGWFLRRYDQRRSVQFLRFIDELPALSIMPFGGDEVIKAGRVAKKFSDQALTLADAHGLVVMVERRIATCWSTDRHLGLTGAALAISSY